MTTETRVTDEALDALQTARDHAIQQAQIWKMEANSANATIAEIYRLVGSKAGNWNGAEPVRAALSAALPLLEGGKGEAVAWMIRNKGDGELHWNEELCVFADAASADEMAECLNDGDPPIWEALPLYTAPQPAAPQPAEPVAGGAVDARIADLSALRSSVQSMRDRMMRLLPEHFGDGFDGDYDTMLEVIIWIKSAIAALRANAGGVKCVTR